jgi:AcrR family transcriptional regulator
MARIPVAQRRHELIQAALEVIADHGIDGATTRRIADQANANVAMVHYCWDSKEDLFGDVFDYVATRYREVIEGSDPHTTLPETAAQILRRVMQCYLDSPSFTAATFELVNWARRQHGDRGVAVYEQAFATVNKALLEAAGDTAGRQDINEITYVLATLADGFAVNWLTYGDPAAARQQMEINLGVLHSWLAARPTAPAKAPARRRRTAKA